MEKAATGKMTELIDRIDCLTSELERTYAAGEDTSQVLHLLEEALEEYRAIKKTD